MVIKTSDDVAREMWLSVQVLHQLVQAEAG